MNMDHVGWIKHFQETDFEAVQIPAHTTNFSQMCKNQVKKTIQ